MLLDQLDQSTKHEVNVILSSFRCCHINKYLSGHTSKSDI